VRTDDFGLSKELLKKVSGRSEEEKTGKWMGSPNFGFCVGWGAACDVIIIKSIKI